MDVAPPEPAHEEDPFADSDEWIAAEVRQLFRAMSAYDPKAVEVSQFYFSDFLAKTAGRHMRKVPPWDGDGFWQDGLNDLMLHVNLPTGIILTGWLVCVLPSGEGRDRTEEWWREPVQIVVRLDPVTGRFLGYRMGVGDNRPRGEKALIGLEIGGHKRIELEPSFRIVDLTLPPPQPVGGWAMTVVRGDLPPE